MAITIRKNNTLKQLEKLTTAIEIKTKTGVIDYIVERHLPLLRDLKEAKQIINKLENELFEIKTVVGKNTQAVKAFADMCDRINGES